MGTEVGSILSMIKRVALSLSEKEWGGEVLRDARAFGKRGTDATKSHKIEKQQPENCPAGFFQTAVRKRKGAKTARDPSAFSCISGLDHRDLIAETRQRE
jgi:hypothetical protein